MNKNRLSFIAVGIFIGVGILSTIGLTPAQGAGPQAAAAAAKPTKSDCLN
jgi:hypothetical protein